MSNLINKKVQVKPEVRSAYAGLVGVVVGRLLDGRVSVEFLNGVSFPFTLDDLVVV